MFCNVCLINYTMHYQMKLIKPISLNLSNPDPNLMFRIAQSFKNSNTEHSVGIFPILIIIFATLNKSFRTYQHLYNYMRLDIRIDCHKRRHRSGFSSGANDEPVDGGRHISCIITQISVVERRSHTQTRLCNRH
jgi:hypothetical protein